MNTPKTAVVILNWNGSSLLKEFLPSVLSGTDPADAVVIVVDNGSTDDSMKVMREKFPQTELICFENNYGFAEGYNRAVSLLRDRFSYVVLLNSDVAVKKGWVKPLNEFMDGFSNVGACQPKILSYRDKTRFEYAGASGGFIDRHGYPYCRGRIFSACESDKGQYDYPMPVFWATGAAMMVRTELYLEAGGLDSKFFAHMEEIDLCWRLQLLGRQIWVVPESVVYHLGGGSLPAENPRKTYLNFRNNLLLLHKNLPDRTRRKTLFVRRLLDTLAWIKFIVSLDFRNASAVLRAHRDFRKMAREYTHHPWVDLLAHRNPRRPNILVEYYLKRKKRFSDLPQE